MRRIRTKIVPFLSKIISKEQVLRPALVGEESSSGRRPGVRTPGEEIQTENINSMDKFVSICSRIVLAPLFYSMVKTVKGGENIPKKGNFILASNHLSHLDWFIDGYFCTPRRFTFIAQIDKMTGKMAMWRNLLYGYAQVIPVDRNDRESKKAAVLRAIQALKDGYILIIYPEGTRSRDGLLQEFKPGIGKLYLESEVPILPVALKGTFDLMPPGKKMKIKKIVEMEVGKPLEFFQEKEAAKKMEKSSDEYFKLCGGIAKKTEEAMRVLLSK
jgi:1-acyl-sn-glycerol-3-phosphate acyltransferase